MSEDEAIEIALEVLYKEIDVPDDDEIVCTQIEKTDEGYYIECNSRVYMETEDLMYALVIAPLMIRPDGSHRFVF